MPRAEPALSLSPLPLSAVVGAATLRQQQRDVLDYLTEACAAAMRGDQAPSRLPNTSVIQSGV